MRSPRYFSVAARAPNGEIVVHTEAIEKTWIGRQKWLKLPFLRGSLAILDSMALGYRALRFSTDVQLDPRYQPADPALAASNEGSRAPQSADALPSDSVTVEGVEDEGGQEALEK